MPYVLCDSFLGSAFGEFQCLFRSLSANILQVVFDQDIQDIHLAQSANRGTNLVPTDKGVDAVPSLQGDCKASTVAIVATPAVVVSYA
jgi:hypothetical protein